MASKGAIGEYRDISEKRLTAALAEARTLIPVDPQPGRARQPHNKPDPQPEMRQARFIEEAALFAESVVEYAKVQQALVRILTNAAHIAAVTGILPPEIPTDATDSEAWWAELWSNMADWSERILDYLRAHPELAA